MKFSLKIFLSLGYLVKVEMSEEEVHPFDFIIQFTYLLPLGNISKCLRRYTSNTTEHLRVSQGDKRSLHCSFFYFKSCVYLKFCPDFVSLSRLLCHLVDM